MTSLNQAVIYRLQKKLGKLTESSANLLAKKQLIQNKLFDNEVERGVLQKEINNLNKEN